MPDDSFAGSTAYAVCCKGQTATLAHGLGFDRRKRQRQIGNRGLDDSKGNITRPVLVITGGYDAVHSLLVPFSNEIL